MYVYININLFFKILNIPHVEVYPIGVSETTDAEGKTSPIYCHYAADYRVIAYFFACKSLSKASEQFA